MTRSPSGIRITLMRARRQQTIGIIIVLLVILAYTLSRSLRVIPWEAR
jgi:hypothetical protein